MRWYCVHLGLPLQAELCIRAAPDSSAIERARISRGSAIAACSPEFQVPASDGDAHTTSWLQVVYLDIASGKTELGYIMVALDDGSPLVIPWESTDFSGCCEVKDPASLMYNGPEDVAQALGAVQNNAFLYCMMEERDQRVKIYHPELESVWVDRKNLQFVCTRLKHRECSTPHAFYELNEELPEEAQIAIRTFPSREAQALGLLSRGETLEVTVRNENWLRISGGSFDKAWIMWRADALQLLLEAPDVCSRNCKKVKVDACKPVEVTSNLIQDYCTNTVVEKPASMNASTPEATRSASTASMVIDGETISVGSAVQASENCTIWSAPSALDTAVIHDIAGDAAVLPPTFTHGSCNASAFHPAAGENTEDVEHAHVVKYEEECMPVHDDIDDADDAGINADLKELKVVSKQVTQSCYERKGHSSRLVPKESGGDDSNVAGDHHNLNMFNSESKRKEAEDGEFTLTVSSQDIQPVNGSIDLDNTVVKAVPSTVLLEAKIIGTDAGSTNDVEAMEADLSSIDLPMRPLQGLVDNTWSGISLNVAEETKGTVPEFDSQLRNECSLWPTANSNGEIGIENDTTMIIDDGSVIKNDVTMNAVQSLRATASLDDCSNRFSSLTCIKPDDNVINSSTDIKYVCPVSRVGEYADGVDVAQSFGDRPIPLERVQNGDESISSSTVACRDNVSSDVDAKAKGDLSADVDHRWDEQLAQPAKGNNVGDAPAFVTAVDAVSTNASFDHHLAKSEDVKHSHTRQSWSDQLAQALSPISNVARDEILHSWDSLSTSLTDTVHNVVDGDGQDLSSTRKGKSSAVEHAQSWSHPPVWPEEIVHDVQQPTRVTLKERILTIPKTCDASFAIDETEEVKHCQPPNQALESVTVFGRINGVAASAESITAVENVADDVGTRKTHSLNVRSIGMDKAKDAEGFVQIEPVQSASDSKAVCYSGVIIPTVRGQHFSQTIFSHNVFEKGYAELETPSGSESGEIALLGGLEDMFEPVDELLPSAHEERFWDGLSATTRMAMGTEAILERSDIRSGEKSESDVRDFCHPARKKNSIENDVQLPSSSSISFLQEHGVIKLCEHKKSLIPPADVLSQAIYEANQDDSDLMLHALVGDKPLSDDWFHDVSLRKFQGLNAEVSNTFNLIMSDASPDEILAAELSDENSGDFDLVSSFKYPIPRRRVLEPPPGLDTKNTGVAKKYHSHLPWSPATDNTSKTLQEIAVEVVPRCKNDICDQLKMSTPSSRLQRKSIATPSSISKPSRSFLRPRLQVTSLKSPVSELPSSLASLEASTFSNAAAPTSGVLLSSRLRRSSASTPNYSRLQSAPSLSRSSSPQPTEASGLPAPMKSFGFRLSKKI